MRWNGLKVTALKSIQFISGWIQNSLFEILTVHTAKFTFSSIPHTPSCLEIDSCWWNSQDPLPKKSTCWAKWIYDLIHVNIQIWLVMKWIIGPTGQHYLNVFSDVCHWTVGYSRVFQTVGCDPHVGLRLHALGWYLPPNLISGCFQFGRTHWRTHWASRSTQRVTSRVVRVRVVKLLPGDLAPSSRLIAAGRILRTPQATIFHFCMFGQQKQVYCGIMWCLRSAVSVVVCIPNGTHRALLHNLDSFIPLIKKEKRKRKAHFSHFSQHSQVTVINPCLSAKCSPAWLTKQLSQNI